MRKSTVLPVLFIAALSMAVVPATPQKTGFEVSERDRWAAERRTAGSAYESVYLPDSRTLYFAYNSCRDIADRPFAAFAAGLWDTVRNNPVEKLVIDLRNNGGGDSPILAMIARIRPPGATRGGRIGSRTGQRIRSQG